MSIWLTLIAQYGVPAAYKLWSKWRDKTEPTAADWNELLAMVGKKIEDFEKPKG